MNEDILLERIRNWKNEPQKRGRRGTDKKIASILNHLRKILNTRQGNALIADDYGVPDLTYCMQNYPDSLVELEQSIIHTISTYEPRLDAVKVMFIAHEESNFSIRFQILAQLKNEPDNKVIRIETIIDSDGRVLMQ